MHYTLCNKNIHYYILGGLCPSFLFFGSYTSLLSQSSLTNETKNTQVRHQEQEKGLYKVKITPNKPLNQYGVKALLSNKVYKKAELQSQINIGEESLFDSYTHIPEENFDTLELNIDSQRTELLNNLLETNNLSEKESEKLKKQYKKEEIIQSVSTIKAERLKVNQIAVIVNEQDKAEQLVRSIKEETHIDKVKLIDPKVDKTQIDKTSSQKKKSVFSGIKDFFNPVNEAFADAWVWFPNYTSIAFFDTDETDFYTYDEWDPVAENYGATAYTLESPEVTWHWGRAYIAYTGTNGYTRTGVYGFDQYGNKYWDNYHFNNNEWLKGPSQWDKNPAMVSWNGELYQAVRAEGNNDNIMIRHGVTDSNNYGKPNFGNYTNLQVQTEKDFGMTVHNGQLCIAYQPINTNDITWGCSWNGTTFSNWQTMSNLPGGGTDQGVEIESAHGDIYFSYSGRNDDKLYVYDTWNGWRHLMNGYTENLPALSKHGDNSTGNEKLCLLHRGTDYNGQMWKSCLYRYGQNYDQWNWHPWQRQQGETNDSPAMTYDDGILAQLHRGLDNKVYLRILRKPNPAGRGYLSTMKWDQAPYSNSDGAYEHEVYLYRFDDQYTNYQQRTYLSQDTQPASNEVPTRCRPMSVRYWTSDLPSNYLDTRLDLSGNCDSENTEISYTIGSKDAEEIDSDRYYFTYMHLFDPSSSEILYRPLAKVQGQNSQVFDGIGSRNPIGWTCDGEGYEWCVFKKYNDLPGIPWDNPDKGDENFKKLIPYDLNQTNRGWTYPYWFREGWNS